MATTAATAPTSLLSAAPKNQLAQLKQHTTAIADTGNFRELAQFAPQDATINPSLILKAVQQAEYAPLLALSSGRCADGAWR